MQMPEKVGKPRTTVFPMICGSGGSKSRLAKAAGAEPCGHMRDEKLHAIVASSTFPSQNVQSTPTSDNFGSTPLWHEAHFQAKMYKTHQGRSTFGSWDVEKVRAVVARSTFPSQNVQNTPGSERFWKLRCRKSARRCGTKHISKSKGTQNTRVGALLEVEMSKKCAPLWHEAHFQIKRYTKHPRSEQFWKLRWRKSARNCGAKHVSKSKGTQHTRVGALLEVEMLKKCTLLLRREAHVQVKSAKADGHGALLDVQNRSDVTSRAGWPAQGIVHLVKSEKKTGVA